MQSEDSLPNTYTISGRIDFSGGISFEAENIKMVKNEVPAGKSFNPKLIVLNGNLLTPNEAKNAINNFKVRNAEIQILAANNNDAIRKYGEGARDGVMIVDNAILENMPQKPNVLTVKGPRVDMLVILDGEKLPRESFKETLKDLDPNSIATINVLKDKSATDKYQEEGKNGVIEITTKSRERKLMENQNKKDSAELIL